MFRGIDRYRLAWKAPVLFLLIAASRAFGGEHGGYIAPAERAYLNDVYGISLSFSDVESWNFTLDSLRTYIRGEFVVSELLKAVIPKKGVNLVLEVANDSYSPNWEFYSSIRRGLRGKFEGETIEHVVLNDLYESLLWRYTSRVKSRDYAFSRYFFRRPGANFCLTIYSDPEVMEKEKERLALIADTVRFYDTARLGGELKRVFLGNR